jgi:hypothetical protein
MNRHDRRRDAGRQAIWDEARRRAAERGGDPDEHLRAMFQEVLNSAVADGIIGTAGLNAAGKMVYRSKIYHKPR